MGYQLTTASSLITDTGNEIKFYLGTLSQFYCHFKINFSLSKLIHMIGKEGFIIFMFSGYINIK